MRLLAAVMGGFLVTYWRLEFCPLTVTPSPSTKNLSVAESDWTPKWHASDIGFVLVSES